MTAEIPSIIELERYLTADEVATWYGVKSKVTLWRWRKEGRLPNPDLMRGRLQRWKVRSLIEWDKVQTVRDHKTTRGITGKSLLRRLGLS